MNYYKALKQNPYQFYSLEELQEEYERLSEEQDKGYEYLGKLTDGIRRIEENRDKMLTALGKGRNLEAKLREYNREKLSVIRSLDLEPEQMSKLITIESSLDNIQIALEEDKSFIRKLINGFKKFINWLIDKCGEFVKWIIGYFKSLSFRYRQLPEKLKKVDSKEFEENFETLIKSASGEVSKEDDAESFHEAAEGNLKDKKSYTNVNYKYNKRTGKGVQFNVEKDIKDLLVYENGELKAFNYFNYYSKTLKPMEESAKILKGLLGLSKKLAEGDRDELNDIDDVVGTENEFNKYVGNIINNFRVGVLRYKYDSKNGICPFYKIEKTRTTYLRDNLNNLERITEYPDENKRMTLFKSVIKHAFVGQFVNDAVIGVKYSKAVMRGYDEMHSIMKDAVKLFDGNQYDSTVDSMDAIKEVLRAFVSVYGKLATDYSKSLDSFAKLADISCNAFSGMLGKKSK